MSGICEGQRKRALSSETLRPIQRSGTSMFNHSRTKRFQLGKTPSCLQLILLKIYNWDIILGTPCIM